MYYLYKIPSMFMHADVGMYSRPMAELLEEEELKKEILEILPVTSDEIDNIFVGILPPFCFEKNHLEKTPTPVFYVYMKNEIDSNGNVIKYSNQMFIITKKEIKHNLL